MVDMETIEQYRRLQILHNRLMLFGNPIFYTYWREFIFRTDLGLRRVISTSYKKDDETINELIYEDPETGVAIFNIIWTREKVFVTNTNLSFKQVWLAVYELEQLSAEICRDIVKED